MDKSILKSRIESMNLDEIVYLFNNNRPKFDAPLPTIYRNEGNDFKLFLNDILDNYGFEFLRKTICRINPADRYLQVYEGNLFRLNELEDFLHYIATVDNLADYYSDYDEIDIDWPQRIIDEA